MFNADALAGYFAELADDEIEIIAAALEAEQAKRKGCAEVIMIQQEFIPRREWRTGFED